MPGLRLLRARVLLCLVFVVRCVRFRVPWVVFRMSPDVFACFFVFPGFSLRVPWPVRVCDTPGLVVSGCGFRVPWLVLGACFGFRPCFPGVFACLRHAGGV